MQKTTGVIVAMMLLAGCQTTGSDTASNSSAPAAKPAATAPAPTQTAALPETGPASADLHFIGLAGFDSDLSDAMAKGTREITVNVPGKFSVNDVPERLDRWLSLIKESGGQIEMAQAPQTKTVATRGVLGWALEIGEAAYESYRQEQLYAPAAQYDVRLEYDPATGKVGKMVFMPR